MTSLLIRMLLVVSSILLKSLPASSGAARIAHRLIWLSVLVCCHATIAYLEHVRIVPVARSGEPLQPRLRETNQRAMLR